MNRKQLKTPTALLSIAVSALLVLTSCANDSTPNTSESPQNQESGLTGVLNIIGYAGIWEERYREAVVKPFEDANPGVTVNYAAKGSSAEMLSALQSQKTNQSTDVALMDQSVAKSGNDQGLFAKITEADVPNLSGVKNEFLNPEGYGPVLHLDAIALLYDTETFAEAPTSWSEMWNEQWAGQINLMAPPSLLGLAATAFASTLEGEDYTQSIEKGVAKLKELAPNVQTFAPSPDGWQHIITGQSILGIGQNARGQYYSDESNGKLGIAFPVEGTVYQVNTINVTEGAPNKVAAMAFVNWALSPEAQLAFAEALWYAPSVEVDIPAETAARIVSTDGSMKILPWDVEFVDSIRDDWTEIWKREIIAQ